MTMQVHSGLRVKALSNGYRSICGVLIALRRFAYWWLNILQAIRLIVCKCAILATMLIKRCMYFKAPQTIMIGLISNPMRRWKMWTRSVFRQFLALPGLHGERFRSMAKLLRHRRRNENGKFSSFLSDWWNYIDPDRWRSVPRREIWNSLGEITWRYSH